MGGDHKCPVCQATFTRPQHVARHMRSHTGDRPYKCLYCGDQFARSDLLSRHVNKCHSNEKPLPSTTTRRKGSAASRATTSKQACDQCVQSSLPCDGANPCTKCVQRKCRCTFVKFHRQTAPVGPGHVPPPVPPSSNPLEPPSSRLRSLSGSIAPLYAESFDFPPVYPTRLDTVMNLHPACNDYAPRHRANAADFPNRTTMRDQSSRQGMYPLQTSGTWSGWDQGAIQDSQGMRFSSRDHNLGVGDFGISPTIGSYPLSISTHRRESLDYSGSESSASYSEPSSVPTSARSSTAHIPLGLPLQPLTMQMSSFPASSMGDHSYNQLQPRSHEIRPSTSPSSPASATIPHPLSIQQSNPQALPHGEGSFSSAFGLMSLEDAKVLAGLAADGAPFFSHAAIGMDANTDPDATPMPMQMDQRPPHSQHLDDPSRLLPKVNMTQPQPWSPVQSFPAPTRADRDREGEARELREFWREYMRTPLSGPGIGGGPTDSPGGGMYRRPRVNSLPAKTPLAGPGITGSYGYGMGYSGQPTPLQAPGIGTGMPVSMALPRRPSTGMAVTFPPPGNAAGQQTQQTPQVRHWHGSVEDLRSYEAAVLARQAPTNLSLKPKRRGTTSVVGSGPGLGSGGRGSASVGASPRIPSIAPGAFRGGDMAPGIMKAEDAAEQGSRRWDGMEVEMTATMPPPPPSQAALSTSSSSSSLANVFGSSHVAGQMQPPSAGCRMSLGAPSDYAGRSESNASPAPGWRQVSRESSLSVSDGSPRSMACEVGGRRSPGETMARPPFKRLPSQTLEPVNAKRTQLRAPGEEASDEERQEPRSGKERHGMTLAERRRRMSVGSGKASARFELDLGTLEK